MNTEDLKLLAEKVEAGTARPPEVWDAFNSPCQDMDITMRCEHAKFAYKGSLDAAKALHDAVLPGWRWEGGSGGLFDVWDDPAEPYKGSSDIPARAWLLAILRALIAEAQQ